METKMYNQAGEEVGKITLPDSVFGLKMNNDLVHAVAVAHMANARPSVAHAKDRSEVRGGGKKPWRQKGTGRARHASIRSPLWRSGGVTFGPRSTDNYSKKVNKKEKQKGLFMVLSSKVSDSRYIVVDKIQLQNAKTKEAFNIISVLSNKMEGYTSNKKKSDKVIVVTPMKDRNLEKALNNVPHLGVLCADSLNIKDIMQSKYVILLSDAIKTIEKTYKA